MDTVLAAHLNLPPGRTPGADAASVFAMPRGQPNSGMLLELSPPEARLANRAGALLPGFQSRPTPLHMLPFVPCPTTRRMLQILTCGLGTHARQPTTRAKFSALSIEVLRRALSGAWTALGVPRLFCASLFDTPKSC
jgi:hypothetical protein